MTHRNGRPLQDGRLQEAKATTTAAALLYLTQGWAVVPIPSRSKAPHLREWQNRRITPEEVEAYFTPLNNIGLLLGEPSGGLVDVDLDCEMARKLAPYFLPPTGMIHGRDSARFSHWWYRCPELKQTIRLQDPEQRHTIAEIRSTGGQTVVPPSIHPSGEALRWETETLEPARVDAELLIRAGHFVGASAMLAERWRVGTRHHLTLALAGALCRAGWTEEQALHFVEAIASESHDEELNDRLWAVRDTYKAIREGREATGLPTLIALLGERVVENLREWLGVEARAVVRMNGGRAVNSLNFRTPIKSAEVAEVAEVEPYATFEVEPEDDDVFIDGEELLNDTTPAVEFIPFLGVDGLIARGATTLLAGTPKAGKTTLLVHACREWIRQGLKVVYITEERLKMSWKKRVLQFPELRKIKINKIHNIHPSRWIRRAKALQPDVIIVDTVGEKAEIEDEADPAAVRRALREIISLADEPFRPAVILGHHFRKRAEGESVHDVAGSREFAARVDTVMFLTHCQQSHSLRELTVYSSRAWDADDPTPFLFELSEDKTQVRYVGRAGKTERTTEWDVVREYLQQKGEATYDEILEALQEAGFDLTQSALERRVTRWKREGRIITVRKGFQSKTIVRLSGPQVILPNSHNFRNSRTFNGGAEVEEVGEPCCDSQQSADTSPDGLPRSPLVIEENDPLEQFIEQHTRPDDPFPLDAPTIEALRIVWSFAEATDFPALNLAEYGYTIPAGREGWAQALPDIAQVGLLHAAIKQIQAVCSHTGQDTHSHSDMGHDGIVPSTT